MDTNNAGFNVQEMTSRWFKLHAGCSLTAESGTVVGRHSFTLERADKSAADLTTQQRKHPCLVTQYSKLNTRLYKYVFFRPYIMSDLGDEECGCSPLESSIL